MSSPIERTSRADLNGAAHTVLPPGRRVSSTPVYPLVEPPRRTGGGYDWAELAERADVSIPTLRHWVLAGYLRPIGAGLVPRPRRPAPIRGSGDLSTAGVRSTVAFTGVRIADSVIPPDSVVLGAAVSGEVSDGTEIPGAADFAAVDVVRLAALARLVRSGVPLARAADLVRDPGRTPR